MLQKSNVGADVKKFSAIFLVFVLLSYTMLSVGLQDYLFSDSSVAYADESEDKEKNSDDSSGDKEKSSDDASDDKEKTSDEDDAKSEDDEKELDEERNMYAVLKDSPEDLSAVKEAIKYDEQLQYLTTYTILKDSYMGEGYASMYFDDNGWANGAEKNLNININTGYKKVMGSESASNSHEEKEIKDEEKAEKTGEGKTEGEKAREELLNIIVDKLEDLYLLKFLYNKGDSKSVRGNYDEDYYGMSPESSKAKKMKSEYGIQFSSSCFLKTTPNQKVYCQQGKEVVLVGSTYPNNKSTYGFYFNTFSEHRTESTQAFKTAKAKFKQKGTAYNVVRKSLEKDASAMLTGSKDSYKTFFEKDFFTGSVSDKIGDDLLAWISADEDRKLSGLGEYRTNQTDRVFITKMADLPKSYSAEQIKKKSVELYDKYDEVAQILPLKARVDSKSTTYTNALKEWKKDTAKAIQDYKNLDKALEYSKDLKTEGKDKVEAGNLRALGWLPLQITVEQFMKTGDKDKFEELIKSYDGGTASEKSDYRVTRSEVNGASAGTRYLRTNDFFNNEIKSIDDIRNSSSPYLSFKYNEYKNTKGNAYISTSKEKLQKDNGHLGAYSGIKMNDVKSFTNFLKTAKNLITKNKFYDRKSGVAVALTIDEIQEKETRPVHKLIAYRASQKKLNNTSNAQYVMGVDNYGNIISGADLTVIIPYWLNTSIDELDGLNSMKESYVVSPTMHKLSDTEKSAIVKDYKGVSLKEKSSKIKSSDKIKIADDKIAEFNGYLDSLNSSSAEDLQNISKSLSQNKAVQAYALIITQKTKGSVEKWNKRFVKISEDLKEVYMINDDADQQSTKDDTASVDNSFNEKDLLEKLRQFFDGGAYDLLKRTIISAIVSFYTSSVFNFTLGNTFYTTLVTDLGAWPQIQQNIITLFVALMGVYILYMAFQIMRKVMTWKQFAVQFLVGSLILLVPTVIYAPLIHKVINDPTQVIMGKQMEQMSIIDTNLSVQEKKRTEDEKYRLLYGNVDELRDRAEDYIVKLYTTTHVDGFDVANLTYDDLPEKNKEKNRLKLETNSWGKSDLVSVKVSIFDIFEWASDEDNSSVPLFTWLADKDSERYKDLSKYTELSYDTLSKYTSWIDKDSIQKQGLSGSTYTASDIYKMIYQKTQDEKISNAINGVYNISEVFRNRENAIEMNIISDGDRQSFVRDLAFSGKSRERAFGASNQLSPMSMQLFSDYANEEDIPDTDLFGLTDVVAELVPYQQHNAPTLSRNVYEINKDLLNQYITNYSIVRESLGSENTDVKLAEFKIISLNMWFRVNEELGLNLFPTSYQPETVSLDSFVRLVYIPMADYKDLEDNSLNNVSKYIALREQVVPLIAFLLAILAIMLFGGTYLIIFSFLMMVIAVCSFVYNYVWKKNYESKAWLGSLMIIATFALVKIGFLCLWYAMSYLLNYQYVVKGGNTYSYTIIHSLVIIGYIYFAFVKAFIPLLKHVTSDINNLGAESMKASLLKVKGNFTGTVIASLKDNTKGSVGRAGRVAGWGLGLAGAGVAVGKGVKNLLASEGTESTLSDKKLKRESSKFSKGNLKNLINRKSKSNNKSDVESISESASGTTKNNSNASLSGKIPKTIKGSKRISLKKEAKLLDAIEITSLANSNSSKVSELEKAGAYGSVVSSTRNGIKLTELPIANEEIAKQFMLDLSEKGISSATSSDGNLILDTTGLNYSESSSIRKSLLGSSLTNLADHINNIYTAEVRTMLNDDSRIAYHMDKDNSVTLGVGKSGISKNSLDAILSSKVLTDNFEIISQPEKTDDGYTDDNIQLQVKNKNANISEVMSKIAKADATLRLNNSQDDVRSPMFNDAKELVFGNPKDIVVARKHFTEGMVVQDGKIVYDNLNPKHVKAIKNMKEEMNQSVKESRNVKSDILTRLTAQVVRGENNGYDVTETVIDPSVQDAYSRQMRQIGLRSATNQTTTVFTGKHTKEIVDSLNNIKEFVSDSNPAIKTYGNVLNSSINELENHYDINNSSVTTPKAVENLSKYISNMTEQSLLLSNGEERQKIKEIKDKYSSISENLKDKNAKPALEALKNDLKSTLQSNGLLAQTSMAVVKDELTRINKKSKTYDKLKNLSTDYHDSTKELNKNNLNASTLEKLMLNDSSRNIVDNVSELAQNLTNVKANSDGTIKLDLKNYDMSSEEISKALKTLIPNLD